MAQHLPQQLAVDRPLKLGATFAGNTTDGFLTLQYDFQPDSMKRVAQGDLLFFGKEQEQIKFIPDLPEGDAPFHFEGPCRTLQQQDTEDTECIAIFDGQEWTLQLVSARITAKHVRGTPQIPGYNVDLDDEQGAGIHQAAAPASGFSNPAVAAEHQDTADDDIDPDLNDALEEALFAADIHDTHLEHQQHQQPSAVAAPSAQAPPMRQQQQRQPIEHQATQQQQHIQQQQHHQQVHGDDPEDSDDPWAEYSAPEAPAATAHPSAATAAPPGAAAAGVRVVSHEEDQDDEEEEAVHNCSEDESDGLGVEVF